MNLYDPLRMRFVDALYKGTRAGIVPEAICLHMTDQASGGLDALDSWFTNPASNVSAHFGIDRDGTVHQYVPWHLAAFGNGLVEPGHTAKLITDNPGVNPNAWSISIEHVGRGGETLTVPQWEASTALSAHLFAIHLLGGGASGVAVDRDHVLGHFEISPRTRARCPGWPEEYLQGYVNRVRVLLEEPQPVPDPRVRTLLDTITVYRNHFVETSKQRTLEAAGDATRAADIAAIIERFR